jgi:hypothetical protein
LQSFPYLLARIDHDNPLRGAIAIELKEHCELASAPTFDDVRKELTTKSPLLIQTVRAQVQHFWTQETESHCVDPNRRPDSVEVARLLFGRNETPVQPDPRAASIRENRQSFSQPVQEPAADQIPTEAFKHLNPGCRMLSRRE